jgi:hypothetical protein
MGLDSWGSSTPTKKNGALLIVEKEASEMIIASP